MHTMRKTLDNKWKVVFRPDDPMYVVEILTCETMAAAAALVSYLNGGPEPHLWKESL